MFAGWLVVRRCFVSAAVGLVADVFGIGRTGCAAIVTGEVAIGDVAGCGVAVVAGIVVAPTGNAHKKQLQTITHFLHYNF